jgi:hypothetical protein
MISKTGHLRLCIYGFCFALLILLLFCLVFLFPPGSDRSAIPSEESSKETIVHLSSPAPLLPSAEPIPLRLFYRKRERLPGDTSCLIEEKKLLPGHADPETLALSALKELALSSDQGNPPAVPTHAVPLHIWFLDSGTAVINYNQSLGTELTEGVEAEMACVYAIVHTITGNFPKITTVRLLIEGKEQETLCGHIGIAGGLHPLPLLIQGQENFNRGIYTEPLPP